MRACQRKAALAPTGFLLFPRLIPQKFAADRLKLPA
jgi:hypothetical protein